MEGEKMYRIRIGIIRDMKSISFTAEGYEKIKKEYAVLKTQRVEAVAELKRARELGDLSENAAYKVARQRVNQIDSRLRRLTLHIRLGKVVNRPFTGVVDINTKVTVISDGVSFEFQIVGEQEADPASKKISPISPLGRAVMGKRRNDTVIITTPSGEQKAYTIVDVIPI
jgi:transcription elongation factor GreA